MNRSQLTKFFVVPFVLIAAITITQPVSARVDTPSKAISPKVIRDLKIRPPVPTATIPSGQRYGFLQIFHRNVDPASSGLAGEPMNRLFQSGGFVCNNVDALDPWVVTGRYSDPSVPSWGAYVTCQITPGRLTEVQSVSSHNEMYETCRAITCDFTFEDHGASEDARSLGDETLHYYVGKFIGR